MKRILIIIMIIMISLGISFGNADSSEMTTLYVTANHLNGRSAPRKNGFIECIFDYGDALTATGKWSNDHKWVEVLGGESGTVWVNIAFVTETKNDIYVMSLHSQKIRIRNRPVDGRIKGYLKKNKRLKITQTVLGWGKCATGWIDLECLIVLDE